MRPGPLLLVLTLGACGRGGNERHGESAGREAVEPAESGRAEARVSAALGELRREEAALRARTDFATLAPSSRSIGANPYALAALPGARGLVGILRGDSRVVVLDERLAERSS